MVIYTSGSTGKPKGVVSTYANLEYHIGSLVSAWEWEEEDRIIHVLPLHHIHGVINKLLCALWSGSTVMFMKFDERQVWDAFQHATLFMAVPAIYAKLIAYYDQQDEKQRRLAAAASELRLMVSGSSALPQPIFRRWYEITNQVLLERYGMTEIGMCLTFLPNSPKLPGYVGQPLPNIDVRVDEDTNELLVKGPNVFRCYLNRPDATKEAFTKDGYFKTGDIVSIHPKTHDYRIEGRSSVDIIKSSGYKISALEIEPLLLQHDAVIECAVLGLPDDVYGEVVTAVIVTPENFPSNLSDLLSDHLEQKLPRYKHPR
eukprot:CAMPEP_0117422530 /NCGR_PEP_ID=MMETSP0758-20121206/3346_1 /TAXON_ID=63605 /ORGANISM="Percolomonas cosmopolitus, Strain AE-1 (ATCC 50343)" /LENGTH=314 /DNA_ID=CAMNT_0005205195 /DNA_START=425 /DNA_END=1365 /DNA_ORIENTATION=-